MLRKMILYLSGASPLGVPFNNLRNTGSENWTKDRAESGDQVQLVRKDF